MNVDECLPALRAIDVLPIDGPDGEARFALHDRAGIAAHNLAISAAGFFVVAHLNGENTCADIQTAFQQHTGMRLPADQVLGLVQALDDALLLEGERFEQAYTERREAYRAADARDNRERYPAGDQLGQTLRDMFANASPVVVHDLRGLVAPHLDYARGAPCYGIAYATLAQLPPADRYIVLGTNHAGRGRTVVGTTKDFVTPLGRALTDREFLAALEQQWGRPLCAEELDHLNEHSVELQVQCLQALHPDHSFSLVPLLCNCPTAWPGESLAEDPRRAFDDFAATLRELLDNDDRQTVLIAGADLSHVGAHFGDEPPTTDEFLQGVQRRDRELLDMLMRHEEDRFVQTLAADQNPTRLCSLGCLYVLWRALPTCRPQLLHYHQAVNHAADTHVSCAAAVLTAASG